MSPAPGSGLVPCLAAFLGWVGVRLPSAPGSPVRSLESRLTLARLGVAANSDPHEPSVLKQCRSTEPSLAHYGTQICEQDWRSFFLTPLAAQIGLRRNPHGSPSPRLRPACLPSSFSGEKGLSIGRRGSVRVPGTLTPNPSPFSGEKG